jgi:histone acetyltransferase 1
MQEEAELENFKPEAWIANATSSTTISLVDSEEGQLASFKPSFTYPIFGEAEQVFGYKDLEIILAFDSKNFTPFLNVKYSEKLDDDLLHEKAKMDANVGYQDEEDDDGEEQNYEEDEENSEGDFENDEPIEFDPLVKLAKLLPAEDLTIKDEESWTKKCHDDKGLVKSILTTHGNVISTSDKATVYKINISKFKQIHDRLKLFSLLFIEGASYIQDDDNIWDIYIMLEQKTDKVIGYATCYKYWNYKGGSKVFDSLEKVPEEYSFKGRISQFLIFPTFQNKKFGSLLYNGIYDHWLKENSIIEINIEDPNESFDALRDKNDFNRIVKSTEVMSMIDPEMFLQSSLSKDDLEKHYIKLVNFLHEKMKFQFKQAQRLLEMVFIYLNLDDFVKLIMMKRVYKQNYELLMDFSKEDRNEKLAETVENIKQEYFERISLLIESDEPPANKKQKV